ACDVRAGAGAALERLPRRGGGPVADACVRESRPGSARDRRRRQLPPLTDQMAEAPRDLLDAIDRFGPHLSYPEGIRLDSSVTPDRLVKTHCCFCGQQCGMQLVVKDNTILGIEPWYEFPFNRGMMCPKGVKRYLQQAHPDRLIRALARDPSAPG